MSGWRGLGGNREVPTLAILSGAEAISEEEGGSWGKRGFPRGSEPEASDGQRASASIRSLDSGAGSRST